MSKIKGFSDTISWYDANAQNYAANIEATPSPKLISKFVQVIGSGKKVLDVGCAAGRDTNLLIKSGLKAVGLDLSEPLLQIAKQRYPEIEFIKGNFLHLPFPTIPLMVFGRMPR